MNMNISNHSQNITFGSSTLQTPNIGVHSANTLHTAIQGVSQAKLESELQDDTIRHIHVPTPAVKLDLSVGAQKILSEDGDQEEASTTESSSSTNISGQKAPNGRPLSQEEVEVIQKLRSRDAEVRAHENAHISAAGGLASAASYTFQSGPDGKRYAIGGHVSIDTSPGRTPKETLMKAERIRSAALAPADPSPQDRAVAAQATQMAANARAEMAAEKTEEQKEALRENQEEAQSEATEGSSTAHKTYKEFSQDENTDTSSSIDTLV